MPPCIITLICIYLYYWPTRKAPQSQRSTGASQSQRETIGDMSWWINFEEKVNLNRGASKGNFPDGDKNSGGK